MMRFEKIRDMVLEIDLYIDKLKENELALLKTIDEMEVKIAEREEALRKCSPFVVSIGHNDEVYEECELCKNENAGHKDNCLYVRLCGGVG